MTQKSKKTTTLVRAKSPLDSLKEGALSISFFQTMDDVTIMNDRDALASVWNAVGSDLKKAVGQHTKTINNDK